MSLLKWHYEKKNFKTAFVVCSPSSSGSGLNHESKSSQFGTSDCYSDGSVAYGTIVAAGTADTTSGGVDDTQWATNTGNVNEDFDIKGQNTSSWTLSADTGNEAYFHKFCLGDCDSSPSWTALSTAYQNMVASIASGVTQRFDLIIGVPSITSDYNQQSADVTLLASAS